MNKSNLEETKRSNKQSGANANSKSTDSNFLLTIESATNGLTKVLSNEQVNKQAIATKDNSNADASSKRCTSNTKAGAIRDITENLR